MAKAAEEQPPTPAAAEEPRPAAAEAVAEGAGAAPANYATLRAHYGPITRSGEFFFASVEDEEQKFASVEDGESDDDDGDSDYDDGDSDDDDGSVDMSTWTPKEIDEFNKVCGRGGLGIRYTS
jgi:hypothetical protein